MGSTDQVTTLKRQLFTFLASNFYPKEYRFSEADKLIYRKAVMLGDVSQCTPLSEVDYTKYLDRSIRQVREMLGVEEDLLRAYYQIEKKMFPKSRESQRLLD